MTKTVDDFLLKFTFNKADDIEVESNVSTDLRREQTKVKERFLAMFGFDKDGNKTTSGKVKTRKPPDIPENKSETKPKNKTENILPVKNRNNPVIVKGKGKK